MAEVVVLLNPLDVSRRRRGQIPDGVPLLAWVDEHEPALGAITRAVYVNGHPCTNASYLTHPHDEVLVAYAPGTLAAVGYYVLQAVIAFAIGYVLSKLFAPTKPAAANTPQASQVYGIAPPQNAARLGQPIPVVYGSVITLPDFAAQPFVRYSATNDQYLYALLCVGQGDHDVTEMLFGDTSAGTLAKPVFTPDVLQWRVYQPADHNSSYGVIEGQITGFAENMVTSPAVGDQELVAPNVGGVLVPSTWCWLFGGQTVSMSPAGINMINMSPANRLAALPPNPTLGTQVAVCIGYNGSTYMNGYYTASAYNASQAPPNGALVPPPTYSGAGITKWIGPFESCKPGQRGSLLELDFTFPSGLFVADGSGNLATQTIVVQIGITQVDDSGNILVAETLYTESFSAKDNTPQRFSRPHTVASGRYRVRCNRQTNSDLKVTTSDHVMWEGLKFKLDPPASGTLVYGNVTLIAVTLKATNGIASNAASSMRFRVTRRLAPLGSGATAATVNPADAFVDVMTAPYGGGRPVTSDELDLTELTASRSTWNGMNGFNAVFDQPSTVWEALSLSVQTVHAAPLPVGSRMSLIHDRPQPVRSQLFTDANIVAGSLQYTAQFDQTGTPAGVKVNYRDPVTFSTASYMDPPNSPDFTSIDLFGCTSLSVATNHGVLMEQKRILQRSQISFETELEGLNCLPGDRIGVSTGMLKWAQAGRVEKVVGLTLTLSVALTWVAGKTYGALLRDSNGVPTRFSPVTKGASAFELVLPSAPSFPIIGANDTQEATLVSFGISNSETTDWTVGKITPNGATVTIEAMNYDPNIWAGLPPVLRGESEPEEVAA
jgi:hypothetical protein